MNKFKFPKECSGCTIQDYTDHSDVGFCVSSFEVLKKIYKHCPCLDCLIKTTCSDPCKRFYLFIKKHEPKAVEDNYEFPNSMDE